MSPSINSARRFYLLKSWYFDDAGQLALAAFYRWKQAQQLSPALPVTFPLREELVAAGYSTSADLNGADAAELRLRAKLTRSQAEAVLRAAAAL